MILDFLRRNLMLALFLCLIIGQLLMWRALLAIQENTGRGSCGSRTEGPCYVVVIPNAR